jgi:nucleoid-associated protein YgaU
VAVNQGQTITVVGGNLWQIAAQYLGDATQAATIAWLNGLSDPMLVGQVTLVLPPPTTASTGGLPPS